MRARFGKLPMSDILAPAIFYAEQGFPVTDVIANAWTGSLAGLAAEPNAAKTYLVGGRAPRAGDLFKNPDLGRSLRLVSEKGAAGFYDGKTAEAILAISRDEGGTMTADDLKQFVPEWVDPIATTYRGWTVYELPRTRRGSRR